MTPEPRVFEGHCLLPDIGTTPVVLTIHCTLDQADALRVLLGKSPREAANYTGLPIERWFDDKAQDSWKSPVYSQLSQFVDRVRSALEAGPKP